MPYCLKSSSMRALTSSLVAVGTTAGTVLLGLCAAFVIARYTFRGRQGLYTFFAAGLMFPVTVAALPLSILLRDLGLNGTFAGLIIPQVAFALPVTIIILVPFLRAIPQELEEAAQLDGATGAQRFWFIIAPMIRPVIAIVLLLQLIWDLRVFTQITMLKDAGSKSGDFDLLGTYIYKLGTSSQDFGMASAVSILVLGITIALSWFYIRSLLKEDAQ